MLQALGLQADQYGAAVTPGLLMSDIGPEQLRYVALHLIKHFCTARMRVKCDYFRAAAAPPVDVWVLALPNGMCAAHASAIEAYSSSAGVPTPLLIDLSADARFDATWVYGLPERPGARQRLSSARRIANPGCYATAAQLAVMPFLPQHATATGKPNAEYSL